MICATRIHNNESLTPYAPYDGTSVIEERSSNSLLAHYRYAGKLLALSSPQGNQYYHLDALGSTTELTDDQGDIKASYHLDPWGSIEDTTGDSINRRIFTGKETDQNTGLIYFGARYYDPETARFITQDSYLGKQDEPPSLHRYLYAYSNPTVYVDLEGYRAATPDEAAELTGWEKAARANRTSYESRGTLGKLWSRVSSWNPDYSNWQVLQKNIAARKAAIAAAPDGESVVARPADIGFSVKQTEVPLGNRKSVNLWHVPEYVTGGQAQFDRQYSDLDAAASAPPSAVLLAAGASHEQIQSARAFWDVAMLPASAAVGHGTGSKVRGTNLKSVAQEPTLTGENVSGKSVAVKLTEKNGTQAVSNETPIYHRITVDPNEVSDVTESGQLWGQRSKNYMPGLNPKVKAYEGPLPEGVKGYEFTTPVKPDKGAIPGQPTWSGNRPGVINDDDWAKIECHVLRVCQ